jgi:hypothetical protein
VIPYFGRWPEWFNLFVESCKWNPEVRWRFYTDCGEPENWADNLDYVHISFEDYKGLVRERFSIPFNPTDSYKLCDLKPCLGDLHGRDIAGYPFYGYGDIDVIYGKVRNFYTDEVLAASDIFSTHATILSGHLAVFRNTPKMQHLYERIPNYEHLLRNPKVAGISEGDFVDVVKSDSTARRLFVERYSTVLSPLKKWHDGTMNYPQS